MHFISIYIEMREMKIKLVKIDFLFEIMKTREIFTDEIVMNGKKTDFTQTEINFPKIIHPYRQHKSLQNESK